ncbi:MAG: hypothetical protein K2K60_03065 [Clostridia bacterium]|nr:hypothetical protein [Clostridia bacterium]
MKKIKKLFLPVVSLALCLCCVIPFAGCKKNNDEGDWVEVYSVNYTFETGESGYFASDVNWEYTKTNVIKEAYELAPEDQRLCFDTWDDYYKYFSGSGLGVDRNKFFSRVNSFINKTYYIRLISPSGVHYDNESEWYWKEVYGNYKIEYVKIQLLENNTLKIKAKGKVIEVQPLLYEIKYFEN